MNRGENIAYYFVLVGLSICLVVLGILLYFIWKKRSPVEYQETPSIKLCARAYTLTDIDAATDGFDTRRIVGQGRLGIVYAAMLEQGEPVAVKRIHPRLVLMSNAGFRFSTLIKSLSYAQHPNIVPIIGFSEAPGERIILMEFVGLANLEIYLHQSNDGASVLDWSHRLRIAAGAARGLEYLHEGKAPSIVHGCVKASNILIDAKFCARVCDYGLANFMTPQEKNGLVGYVDDEYWSDHGGGNFCKESDVYGFGVLLLELLSGRRSEEGLLVKWALPLVKDMRFHEVLDPRLVLPSEMKSLVRLGKVASACVGNSRKSRLSMGQVAAILNNLEMEVCL